MDQMEWYYARGDKQQGPVNSAELKRLAAAGQLRPEDLIWRGGMAEWTAARNVRGLFEEKAEPPHAEAAMKSPPSPPQIVAPRPPTEPLAAMTPGIRRPSASLLGGRHLFDFLLDSLRRLVPSGVVESSAKFMERVGRYGLLAGMALCLLYGVLYAVKYQETEALIFALISVLILAVLQYGSGKFCDALDRLNRNTTYAVCSSAYLDWSAFSSLIVSVAVLLGSVASAVATKSLEPVLYGLAGSVLCLYLALIALHPESIQISLAPESRAGEEAIGVFSFGLKSLIRLTPVAFGAGVVVGCVMMIYACAAIYGKAVSAPAAASAPSIEDLPNILGQISGGGMAALKSTNPAKQISGNAKAILYGSAALPLAAYLLYLLYVLAVEVCRALLLLPAKLDKISNAERETKKPPE